MLSVRRIQHLSEFCPSCRCTAQLVWGIIRSRLEFLFRYDQLLYWSVSLVDKYCSELDKRSWREKRGEMRDEKRDKRREKRDENRTG